MLLPHCPFFLFGMGSRRKLLYRGGVLSDALTGEVVRSWPVRSETIAPGEYRVEIETAGGGLVSVREDEAGVWLEEHGESTAVAAGELSLPKFEGHRHAELLRVLHHEILINIVAGAPVPNLLTYSRPWYRDGAMMCMCLERTGNLHLVRDWVLGLREPYDRNNAGVCEPDNLGQALYLVSLASDANHPLVQVVLAAAREAEQNEHIIGRTDGAAHPVFQTKWLKHGLRRLGLDDRYQVPEVYDSYSALFWMDYRKEHVPGPRFDERTGDLYPYLAWAEAHFHGDPPPMHLASERYPLTWEAEASEPQYQGMRAVSPEYAERRLSAPHGWHAAEMFLYLLEQ